MGKITMQTKTADTLISWAIWADRALVAVIFAGLIWAIY